MNTFKLFSIFIVIALASYFRFGVIANTEIDTPIRADALDYFYYAYNLKNYGVYSRTKFGQEELVPDSLRSPGYPVFLMPLIEWPPTDNMLLKINLFQAILGIFTVLVSWFIYKRFMPYGFALISALLTSFSPHLISFTTYLLTETLFTFLLVISIWLILLAFERKVLFLTFLSGMFIAICALTRPTLNYFIIVVCIFMFFQFGKYQGMKHALSIFLGFILIFSPWILRKMIVIDDGGQSLVINTIHHGMYPDFMYQGSVESKGFPYRFDPATVKISENIKTLTNELKRRFHDETWRHLNWYFVGKPVTLFSWGILNGWGDIFIYPVINSPYFYNDMYKSSRLLMYWVHWPLIFLSICACILVWFPNITKSFDHDELVAVKLFSLLIFYFLLIHIIGAPFPRYSVPLRPFNYGMAMFCLLFILRKIRKAKLQ